MNIPHTRLAAIIAQELRNLGSKDPGAACILEFKLSTKDGTYHRYVQMLLLKEPKKTQALWRKYKVSDSLTKGDTLWEDTREYDTDLVAGSKMMISERIKDLAFKARVEQESVVLSLESSKTLVPDRVSRTRDSEHSYLVRISGKKRHHSHI